MKIDSVTAELRPRSDWEAVDLGLALVRRDFRKLLGAWWLGMLPAVLIGGGLWWVHPVWSILLFWWFVPVGSRLVLFRLSRTLFGEVPGWRDLVRELPRAMFRRWFHRMVWARVSPWRPLAMAVEDLEGLRGADYRMRCRTLMRRGDSSLILVFFWRLGLVLWLAVAVFSTVQLFLPGPARIEWREMFNSWIGEGGQPVTAGFAITWLIAVAWSMCLTDLFATGAGFGIYVNHRTWIEGWDVELAFRRISSRLAKVGLGLMMACALLGGARAEDGPKDTIREVLSHPDFEIHTETDRKAIPWNWWEKLGDWLGDLFGDSTVSSGSSSGAASILTHLATLAKVSLVVLIGAFLVWLIWRNRHVFLPSAVNDSGRSTLGPRARVVMGMEVTERSLPDDIVSAARAAWHAGRRHEAMALLYRGAIAWMIGPGGVEIAESDTEMDCLRRVREASLVEAGYFEHLTQVWSRLAYARSAPSDEVMESLFARWPFGKGAAS